MSVRSRCATCGEPIRRSQLTGRWTHIGPYLPNTRIHDPAPNVINGHFDVETGPTDDAA